MHWRSGNVLADVLRRACRHWLLELLAFLADKPMLFLTEIQVEAAPGVDGQGWSTREGGLNPDYFGLLRAHGQTLTDLPVHGELGADLEDFPPLMASLLTDDAGQPISAESRGEHLYREVMESFLLAYLQRSSWMPVRGSAIDEDAFETTIEDLRRLILHPEAVTVSLLIELRNLDMEVDTIGLEPGVQFRRTTLAEREQAVKRIVHKRAWHEEVPLALLEVERTLEEFGNHRKMMLARQMQEVADEACETAVLGLRLLGNEYVGYYRTTCLSDNPCLVLYFGELSFPPALFEGKGVGRYLLSPATGDQLCSLWN